MSNQVDYSIEHLEDHTARLTVDVGADRMDKAMQEAARRISKQVNIPGFRRGKAPYKVVLQRFGPQAVMEEAIEHLGNDVYKEALDKTGLEPYSMAILEDVKTEPKVQLIFSVPKKPEVTLGDYRSLRATLENPTVEDKQVDSAIDGMLEQRALIEPASRPTQLGDLLKASIHGTTEYIEKKPEDDKEETKAVEAPKTEASEDSSEAKTDEAAPAVEASTESAEKPAEETKVGEMITETVVDEEETSVLLTDNKEKEFLPGISTYLVGMSAGESKQFDLEIPVDFSDEEMAGHTIHLDVTLKEVQSRTLPVLNDEFAKQASDNKFETLLEFRIDVRQRLQEAAQKQAEKQYSDKLFDEIIKQATIKYPPAMVEEYTDDLVKEMDKYLRENNLTLERFKQIGNKTDADIREMNQPQAISRIKSTLVFAELVNHEQISIKPEDIDKRIDELSAQFGDQAAAFRTMFQRPETQNSIAMDLVSKRLSDRLLEIGQGKAPELPEPHVHDHEHDQDHDHHDHAAETTPAATESAESGEAKS